MKTPELQNDAMPTPPEAETPKGRAALMAIYKAKNADVEDDPDDDSLFDFSTKGWQERDDYESKYSSINGANEKLAEVIGQDPRFAQFIAMVAAGENLMYALGKTFGNIIDQLDEEGLENLKKGQAEYSAKFAKVKKNFEDYEANLKQFAEQNGLTPDDVADLDNRIFDIAEAFADREIPMDMLELIWKGADYDNAKTAETEAARLAERNSVIEDVKSKKRASGPLPDMGQPTASKPAPKSSSTPKLRSFAEAFTEKED